MPVTVHAVRVAWRNFIVLLHSLPVVFILLLFFSHSFSYELFFILPGLFLLLANGIWIGIVLGLICTRYRDVNPIVTNLIQVGFFFTPVMWMPELLNERAWIANWNPMYHLIELIRAPMIGRDLSLLSWAWSVGLMIFGFGLAQILMLRARNRVAYWL
jgi:lipopolysaccharide transport system permease protein